MEHARAIETNQTALRRVVEELFALLELVLDGTTLRLPPILQAAAVRLLVPAESALRRLIIVAAHGLKVNLPKPRPMQLGKRFAAKNIKPLSFQLFDTRKRFGRNPARKFTKLVPRVHFFGITPLLAQKPIESKKQFTSIRLCRRFAAFKLALENIPHQAKRLAVWQAKRAAKPHVKFQSPLRPGAPPGFRRHSDLEIDRILRECQRLARYALREAPS